MFSLLTGMTARENQIYGAWLKIVSLQSCVNCLPD